MVKYLVLFPVALFLMVNSLIVRNNTIRYIMLLKISIKFCVTIKISAIRGVVMVTNLLLLTPCLTIYDPSFISAIYRTLFMSRARTRNTIIARTTVRGSAVSLC